MPVVVTEALSSRIICICICPPPPALLLLSCILLLLKVVDAISRLNRHLIASPISLYLPCARGHKMRV